MIYDKPKTLGALLGVVIANFLIGQQTGIFLFLTGAMASLVNNTQTDLWVVDTRTTNVNAMRQLDVRYGTALESIEGVEKVYPYLIAGGSAKFENGKTYGVQLVGSQAPDFRGGPWNIAEGNPQNLIEEGAVSADYFDRAALGGANFGEYFEINGKKVHIAAQTRGARGFGAVYMFTTIDRARYLSKTSKSKVSAFFVKVAPQTDPAVVRDRINRNLEGVRAWLPKDFSEATITTILSTSGIAISFGTLIVFAIISGMVIIGLTLYSAAIDRIKDYATLKAIGASNGYVARLILVQALIIALVGFVIGSGLVEAFRSGIARAGTFFEITLGIRIALFGITLLISLGGAYFAIRRIVQTEPATVFRA